MSEIVLAITDIESDIPAPVEVDTEFMGGLHVTWKFPNGYGASVVNHRFSYGVELGVLDREGSLTYDTPVTDDVIGYIKSEGELRGLLRQIMALPEAP